MTTKNKNKGQIANPDELITALYCRLSVEDMKDHDKKKGEIDESNSITNQGGICQGGSLQKLQTIQNNMHSSETEQLSKNESCPVFILLFRCRF